jgi:hypothetical protein
LLLVEIVLNTISGPDNIRLDNVQSFHRLDGLWIFESTTGGCRVPESNVLYITHYNKPEQKEEIDVV